MRILQNRAFKLGLSLAVILNYPYAGAAVNNVSTANRSAPTSNKPVLKKSLPPVKKPIASNRQASVPKDPNALEVTPDVLLKDLMAGNISVLTEMNSVYQAKQRVNQARANLLPSINLGAMAGGPSSFLLSSVSLLMPFLLPSNWFNLSSEERAFEAEGTSYYLVELNTYASAYALLNTIAGDVQLKAVYDEQLKDQKKIQDITSGMVMVGSATKTDYEKAAAQTNLTFVLGSQIEELVKQETASLRQMMNIPLFLNIQVPDIEIAKAQGEDQSPGEYLDVAIAKAPEMRQINYLILAAQNGVGSAEFSFLDSAALTSTGSGGKSASLSPQAGALSLTLSFGIFPTVSLAELGVQQLQIQKGAIRLQETELLESNIGAVSEAEAQYAQAIQAETLLMQAYQAEFQSYTAGLSDIQNLLLVRSNVTEASVAKLKAKIDLNNLRINLHRVFLSDEFASIHDCVLKSETGGGPFKWIGDIFDSTPQVSIDQLCKQASAQSAKN